MPSPTTPTTEEKQLFKGPLKPLKTSINSFINRVTNARVELAEVTVARLVSLLVLHPLDATKARLQVTAARSPLAVRAAAKGPWFAGFPAAVLGQLPYGVLTFGLFGVLQNEFSKRFPKANNNVITVAAACAADAAGALWLAPAEALKLKVQIGISQSVPQAMKLSGFYQGLGAQVLRDAPFRALHLVCYDYVKRQIAKKSGKEIGMGQGAAVGAAVGGFVGAVTTPLDVVKTRLMSQRIGAGKSYGNWASCIVRTTRTEGTAALFRGLVPRVVYMSASVALLTIVFEASRNIAKKNGWEAQIADANHEKQKK